MVIAPAIALIAGDIIHNVRSALDHLAVHLVDVGSHPPVVSNKTMFPIFKGTQIDEPKFARQVQGVRDSAKNKIRALEPYKDGKGRDLWAIHTYGHVSRPVSQASSDKLAQLLYGT